MSYHVRSISTLVCQINTNTVGYYLVLSRLDEPVAAGHSRPLRDVPLLFPLPRTQPRALGMGPQQREEVGEERKTLDKKRKKEKKSQQLQKGRE